MSRLTAPLPLSLFTLACLAGCSGSSTTSSDPIAGRVQPPAPRASGSEFVAAGYTLHLDTTTLESMLEPWASRGASAQPPQAINSDFTIPEPWAGPALRIVGVGFDPAGDIQVRFRHAHPMPAPTLALPPTATNRADLGYSGRLVILADHAPEDFLGGELVLDPTLVVGAAGYVPAQALLPSGPYTSNAFPYVLLADEGQDNRIGRSNEGRLTGNYLPASGGWQAANLDDGWTGYDVMHAGQSIENTFTLARAALGPSVRLDLALVAKHSEPKGEMTRELRLPPAVVDPLRFAYRMPYGAIDVSQVLAPSGLEVEGSPGTVVDFTVDVRDWDAMATEAGDADLSDETNVALIQPGASGGPTVLADIPALGIAAQALMPIGSGTGQPNSELRYFAQLQVPPSGAMGQDTWVLISAIDPEDADAAASVYRRGLEPDTLVPNPALALPVRTYQVIPLHIAGVPSGGTWGLVWGGGYPDTVTGLAKDDAGNCYAAGVLSDIAAEGDPFDPDLDPGPGEDLKQIGGQHDLYLSKFDASGNYLWGKTFGGTVYFGLLEEATIDLAFDPVHQELVLGGHYLGSTDFDAGPGQALRTTANRTTSGFVVRYGTDGTFHGVTTWGPEVEGVGVQMTGLALDPDGNAWTTGIFFDTVDFDPGAGVVALDGTTFGETFVAKYAPDGALSFAASFGAAALSESASCIAAYADRAYVGGMWRGTTDFAPGAPQTLRSVVNQYGSEGYVSTFDADGAFLAVQTFGNSNDISETHAGVNDVMRVGSGQLALTGSFSGQQVDFTPGAGSELRNAGHQLDGFLAIWNGASLVGLDTWDGAGQGDYDRGIRLTSDSEGKLLVAGVEGAGEGDAMLRKYSGATLLWSRMWGGPDFDTATAVMATAADEYLTGGAFTGTADFDPGPGEDLRSAGGPQAFVLKLNPEGLR